jgi:hypothetical protein
LSQPNRAPVEAADIRLYRGGDHEAESHRGRVYRCCACRDGEGQQLGAGCPKLATARHGTFAVDLPSLGKRRTMRRTGFATKGEASAAPSHVLECERAGVSLDDSETVASYLTQWLETKSLMSR